MMLKNQLPTTSILQAQVKCRILKEEKMVSPLCRKISQSSRICRMQKCLKAEGSKANNEAAEETTVIDHEEEKKVAAESESVTPEDAEVAEIDAMQSKVIREQGTPVTFGISAMEAVREIRFRIEQKTQLTASQSG